MPHLAENKKRAILSIIQNSGKEGIALYTLAKKYLKEYENIDVELTDIPYRKFVSKMTNVRFHVLFGTNSLVSRGLVNAKKQGNETVYFAVNKQNSKTQYIAR